MVKALGMAATAKGVARAMQPFEGKEQASKADFSKAARYAAFLDVMNELDKEDAVLETLKVTI